MEEAATAGDLCHIHTAKQTLAFSYCALLKETGEPSLRTIGSSVRTMRGAVMEESASSFPNCLPKISLLQAIEEKHNAECAFLRKCCEEGSLTPVQKATILGLIDRITEEKKILEWVMGLVKPTNRESI
jgi:hypothetical protein